MGSETTGQMPARSRARFPRHANNAPGDFASSDTLRSTSGPLVGLIRRGNACRFFAMPTATWVRPKKVPRRQGACDEENVRARHQGGAGQCVRRIGARLWFDGPAARPASMPRNYPCPHSRRSHSLMPDRSPRPSIGWTPLIIGLRLRSCDGPGRLSSHVQRRRRLHTCSGIKGRHSKDCGSSACRSRGSVGWVSYQNRKYRCAMGRTLAGSQVRMRPSAFTV